MESTWGTKRGDSLADDLDILLGELCVQWGFCNGLSAEDLLSEHHEVTSDAFAIAVLAAEGMDTQIEIEWLGKLKRLFADRYGGAASAQTYTPRQAPT